jgi:uncharacterized membrane protein YukC
MSKALTREEAEAKVYELTKRLAVLKQDKKAAAADYRDQLKEVEDEIKGILEEQEEQNTAGTSE